MKTKPIEVNSSICKKDEQKGKSSVLMKDKCALQPIKT